jgi:nucleoside-diphosphate-sugar epimerase
MKVVVIGGSRHIGSKLVDKLDQHGHDAVAADLKTGVNTLTGEGLDDALEGAAREVVTDPQAHYFGINPSERALLPGADARLAETRFSDWLEQQLATA